MPPLRLVAGSAVLALAVAGCGSQSPSSHASKKSSAGASTPSSSPSTPSSSPSTQVESTVQGLRDRVQKHGTGTFSMVTTTIAGKVQASIKGRYSLDGQQVAARLAVPQKTGKPATALVDLIGNAAYFQVAEWKKPSRFCWLRTSTDELSQSYGLDVATTDQVPLPVALLDDFRAARSNGKGLIDGNLSITSVLPMLSGSSKRQLVAAKPAGDVPAFLTFHGNDLLLTIPGYALSTALSDSLKLDASKFSSIAAQRFVAGVKITGPVARVLAPSSNRQMSAADQKANRCG